MNWSKAAKPVAGLPYGVGVTQPWSERTTMAMQVAVGEREAMPAPPDARLAALERGGLWRWGATLTLLVALGVSVVTLYLGRAQAGGTDTPEPERVLSIALCGLVALFGLYALSKESETRVLRRRLIESCLA